MGNEGASYDNMAYIRRQTNKFGGPMGKVVEPEIINAMRGVYGLGTYENKGVTHTERLIPGSTPVQASSSSVVPASSSSSKPVVSSSSVQPIQSSSSSVPVVSSSSQDTPLAITPTAVFKASLTRQGDMLVAQGDRASIRLFDVNGNLVREVRALSSSAMMNLAGLNKGMYIAKSAGQTLKVNVK